MECSNELSAHLAVQHLCVALLSVLTTCQDIPNFHWNARILLEVPVECKSINILVYTHNTVLHLSNGLLMQRKLHIHPFRTCPRALHARGHRAYISGNGLIHVYKYYILIIY